MNQDNQTTVLYYQFPSNRNEMEINLVSLFFEVLRHIVPIVIFGILGVIIGVVVGAKKYENYANYEPSQFEENRIENTRELYDKYQETLFGKNNSYITSLDSVGSVYVQQTRTYYVNLDENSYANMVSSFMDVKRDSKYLDELQSITEFTGKKNTLSSVLSTSFQVVSVDKDSIIINSEDMTQKDDQDVYVLMSITISYLTKEQCEQFSAYIDSWLEQTININSDFYKGLSARMISDDTVELSPDIIKNATYSYSELLAENMDAYDEAYKALSAEELFFYNAMYESDENESMNHSMIKYGLLCGVGLAFVVAFIYVLFYVMAGVVHGESELSDEYGLEVLGRVDIRDRYKGLNKILYNAAYGSSIKGCDTEYLYKVLSYNKPAELLMISTDSDLKNKELVVEKFITNLKEVSDIPVSYGSLVTDAKIVGDARESEGVSILVIPGITKNAELRAQLAVCCKNKICVNGVIVLR